MTAVVLLSGGLDSSTVLAQAKKDGVLAGALWVGYGQRHVKERLCARYQAKEASVTLEEVEIASTGMFAGSALTDQAREMPEGEYSQDNLKQTVVPNRNMVLLSCAIAYAITQNADEVWYGAQAGDRDTYPDCRPAFVEAMDRVAQVCHFSPIRVKAPLGGMTKADVVERAIALGVNMAQTWTCYSGGETPCGTCGSCDARQHAFATVGAMDPLLA